MSDQRHQQRRRLSTHTLINVDRMYLSSCIALVAIAKPITSATQQQAWFMSRMHVDTGHLMHKWYSRIICFLFHTMVDVMPCREGLSLSIVLTSQLIHRLWWFPAISSAFDYDYYNGSAWVNRLACPSVQMFNYPCCTIHHYYNHYVWRTRAGVSANASAIPCVQLLFQVQELWRRRLKEWMIDSIFDVITRTCSIETTSQLLII